MRFIRVCSNLLNLLLMVLIEGCIEGFCFGFLLISLSMMIWGKWLRIRCFEVFPSNYAKHGVFKGIKERCG